MTPREQPVKRGGARQGAGRKPNTEKGLEPPGVVVAARIASDVAAWANEQVANGRFSSVSAYVEHLVSGDRLHKQTGVG